MQMLMRDGKCKWWMDMEFNGQCADSMPTDRIVTDLRACAMIYARIVAILRVRSGLGYRW